MLRLIVDSLERLGCQVTYGVGEPNSVIYIVNPYSFQVVYHGWVSVEPEIVGIAAQNVADNVAYFQKFSKSDPEILIKIEDFFTQHLFDPLVCLQHSNKP